MWTTCCLAGLAGDSQRLTESELSKRWLKPNTSPKDKHQSSQWRKRCDKSDFHMNKRIYWETWYIWLSGDQERENFFLKFLSCFPSEIHNSNSSGIWLCSEDMPDFNLFVTMV
uniref:Uncharacterized protein n=1 Tax=Arion vulgaris TaxID=1028688 RepID=A0A0B7AXA3_9EUPU